MNNAPKVTQSISTGAISIGGKNPLALIAGPCVPEGKRCMNQRSEPACIDAIKADAPVAIGGQNSIMS